MTIEKIDTDTDEDYGFVGWYDGQNFYDGQSITFTLNEDRTSFFIRETASIPASISTPASLYVVIKLPDIEK